LQEHKQTNKQNAINAITKQHKTKSSKQTNKQTKKQTKKQKNKKSKTVVQKDK
jgi:hypothetical protein